MTPTAYDLKEFYACRTGRMIRRLVRERLIALWPDAKGLRVLGSGYALPYLRPYLDKSERVMAQLPRNIDAHHWPEEGRNLVMLSSASELPVETNSIDRLIVIHGLEFSENPADTFAEYWRVLKSAGRMIVVVPNRLGLWSRIDWTPFGYGTPFSQKQIGQFLRDQGFVIEARCGALFVPPVFRGILLGVADIFEKAGGYLCPGFGGVHVIEVSKQVYALTGKGQTARPAIKPKMTAQPEPSPRHF